MKLYNRLINEGIFIFWEDENENSKYILNLFFIMDNKKVKLLTKEMDNQCHYFSIDKIGSGEYLIELNAYVKETLKKTVEKKVNLTSVMQNFSVELQKINESIGSLETEINNVNCLIRNIGEFYAFTYLGNTDNVEQCARTLYNKL